jgi:hypothetical protein
MYFERKRRLAEFDVSYTAGYRKFTTFDAHFGLGGEASRRRCMKNSIGKGLAQGDDRDKDALNFAEKRRRVLK